MKTLGPSDPAVVRAVYDRVSECYDSKKRLRGGYHRWFDGTERKVLRRYLAGQGKVLEVGAGTGRLTAELLPLVQQVVAADISPKMLEHLQEKFADSPKLETRILNVFELDKMPGYGTFDALLSMRMLPHIEHMTEVLKMFRGAVKPGGTLMFDFWNRHSYAYWRKKRAKVYNRFVSPKEARGIIAEAGLELVTIEGAGFAAPVPIYLEFLRHTPLKQFAYSLIAICRRPEETGTSA